MKNYGLTKSTIKPSVIQIDEHSVWICSDIIEIEENIGTENEFIGFQYNMTQYSKDEFIKIQVQEQQTLQERINNTQLALCEIYENIGGEK